ncbi:MAG: ATP-binding protein [Chloroflexota bacterium]
MLPKTNSTFTNGARGAAIAQSIFESRSIAYALVDRGLKVQEVGGAVDMLFQPVFDDQDEQGPAETLYELSPELIGYESEIESILNGTLSKHHLNLVNRTTADHSTSYVLLQSIPIRDAQDIITGLLHVVEDISELGHLRQRLTQDRNELLLLREQLTERNLSLSAANGELKQLDEMKTRFVTTAAHELRTPLSTISGYMEIVLEPGFEELTENQLRCLNIVQRNTKRLIRITDDLLDVSSLDAGRIDLLLRPADLGTLIDMVLKDQALILTEKKLTVTQQIAPDLPKVLCDESRTMQILTNLVSNAIKYTPDDGDITITLDFDVDEEFLLLSVIDTGIGIPKEEMPNLFESLFRASNVHESGARGAGLGLYIVRSLVELQGGRVWAESEEGQGATFYATFPTDDGLFD